jgi:hypothetical protein
MHYEVVAAGRNRVTFMLGQADLSEACASKKTIARARTIPAAGTKIYYLPFMKSADRNVDRDTYSVVTSKGAQRCGTMTGMRA